MENNDRRQRQNNPPGYAGQQGLVQAGTQYPSTSMRQASITAQSPTSAPSAGRNSYTYGYGGAAQFVGPSIQPGAMQYQAEYGQEQRAPSQYQQYGSNVMYNVPSQQPAAPQSPYEPVQPYQPRQNAAIEVLSSQFGVPQQYYVSGEGGPTSAPAAGMAPQNVPSQYPGLQYTSQQSPVSRDTLAPAFTPGMAESSQSATQGAYAQPGYQAQVESDHLASRYAEYQTEVKKINQYVRDGQLSEASQTLMDISQWLLGNVQGLYLDRDEESRHAERLQLWEEFNTCWLTVLQRQKEMAEKMLRTGQRPAPPESLISHERIKTMGTEIVRLCDMVEKFGLVDYQLGVWEEEIVSMLTTCLDQMEEQQEPIAGPSSGTSRRR